MSLPKTLVLFDIDGTLLRGAGPQHKEALMAGIRKVAGLETHLDDVPTAGRLDRDLIGAMLGAAGVSARRIRSWLPQIVTASGEDYCERTGGMDLRPCVCPGVVSFLQQVAGRGATLGLVTGNLRAIGWRKLELSGVREHFRLGAFAEDGRTRARLALVAKQRAWREKLVARGARVTLIGDHLNDIAAAKANGFRAVAVATGVLTLEELRQGEPDYLVNTLAELDPGLVC